jgi:hypothetical protein
MSLQFLCAKAENSIWQFHPFGLRELVQKVHSHQGVLESQDYLTSMTIGVQLEGIK